MHCELTQESVFDFLLSDCYLFTHSLCIEHSCNLSKQQILHDVHEQPEGGKARQARDPRSLACYGLLTERVMWYPANRGRSIFLDKTYLGRSKGFC